MSVSFAGHELHSPRFGLEEARELARERFGVDGAVSELGSHQDQNALIDGPSGRFVLKIANAAFGEAELDLQNRAMLHLAERLPLDVPRPCAALDGSEIVAVERDGVTHLLRLVTFVEGEPLIDALHLAPPVLRALGEVAGLVARALEGFEHPAADRAMQWDPRHVGAVVEALAPHVEDPRRRALAVEVAVAAAEAIERLIPRLRTQIAHCDVTDWNVIGRRDRAGRLMPCGVIDFGDVTRTLRVCELAVAASIAYGHEPDDPICAAAEIVRGFDAACPLDDAELEALPHLIAARAAIVAVGTEQQAALEPHNAYAQRVRAGDWAICETAAAQPPALVDAVFRLACGRSTAALSPRVPAGAWPLPGVTPGAIADLSPAGLDPLTPPGAIGAHGEARWHATRELSNAEPATIHLGLDVFASEGGEVRAPAGRPRRAGGRARAAARGRRSRPAPGGARARRGRRRERRRRGPDRPRRACGRAASAPARAGRARWPGRAAGPRAAGTRGGVARALPAPGARARPAGRRAVGVRAARPPPRRDPAGPAALLRGAARDRAGPGPASLRRAQARSYLDCVNNVAVVGHSHPRVTAAAARQMRLLNTNSRFLYEGMTAFAERLAALLPDPLERVFLVSTGSEANDLALRLARASDGRRDVLCIRDAYHGWTTATYEVSTSSVDNPLGALSPPEGVHPVLSPDTYRGPFGADDPDAGVRYAGAVRDAIERLARGAARPRRSSARRSTATPAASSCPTATWRRPTRTCARPAASASPTRCRSATGAWERISGASSSRASCPTSSRSRRRPATGTRSPR